MASSSLLKFLCVLALASVALAGDETPDRPKKDIMMMPMSAGGMMMMMPGQDDGSYYPGKYGKAFIPATTPYQTVMPYASPLAYAPAPFPYAYSQMPMTKAMVY